MKRNKITDMEVYKVDLVDRPANAHSKIVIAKRDEVDAEDEQVSILTDLLAKAMKKMGMTGKKKKMMDDIEMMDDEDEMDGMEDVMDDMWGKKGKEKKKMMKSDEALALDLSVESILESDEINKAELIRTTASQYAEYVINKSIGEEPEGGEEEMDEIMKRDFEAIQKANADLLAEKEALEKRLNELAEVESLKSFQEVAKSLDKLGVNSDEFGPVLKSISDAVPEAYEKVFNVLKAANNAVDTDLFKEVGSSQVSNDVGNSYQLLEKRAEAVATEKNITKQQAFIEVMSTEEGKKLYDEYLKEGK
jgi:hypothetical protein